VANNVRVWSLNKPKMVKNTTKVKNNAVGAYSLTLDGVDVITFVENAKAITLSKTLELIREKNPVGDIILMLDNLPSHKAHIFKERAEELNIILFPIPPYSPQLQPVEKIWHTNKRDVSSYKIKNIKAINKISKEETKRVLEEEMTKSFYNNVPSKNKWNTIRENYIKPLIKILNPEQNSDWEIQTVNQI